MAAPVVGVVVVVVVVVVVEDELVAEWTGDDVGEVVVVIVVVIVAVIVVVIVVIIVVVIPVPRGFLDVAGLLVAGSDKYGPFMVAYISSSSDSAFDSIEFGMKLGSAFTITSPVTCLITKGLDKGRVTAV